MNANKNTQRLKSGRALKRDHSLAVLAAVVGLGLSASAAFGQYYVDPEFPGWVFDAYNGVWIYVGETNTQQPPEQQTQQPQAQQQPVGGGAHRMVAVGIDNYLQASSLPSCINDVDGFIAGLSQDTERWNSSNISRLTDSSATKQGIRTALYNMALSAGSGDVCVFFQSSHGGQVQGTSMFLSTYDGQYSDTELGTDLANWFRDDVTVVVIVDACFSGGIFKGDLSDKQAAARALSNFSQNVLAAMQNVKAGQVARFGDDPTKAAGSNVGFITASDFDETSAAGSPYSLFAGKMIDALKVSDSDTNGDGKLSFLELFNYAAPRSGTRQTPQVANESLLSSTIATIHKPTGSSLTGVSGGVCGLAGMAPMLACIAMMSAAAGFRRAHRRPR